MRGGALEWLAAGLTVGYAFTQLRFLRDWGATPPVELPTEDRGASDWSVVIAARDEAEHLGATLSSVGGQAAEVIVVDDHSTDGTARLARSYGATVVELPAGLAGKQAALTAGVSAARGAWVATVDADVRVPPGWLANLRAAAGTRAVAVAGPVALAPAHTWFERWQALDFCGMMAITAASLHRGRFAMGNGANLAFRAEAFRAVDGYAAAAGGRASASGDDMVLLRKLLRGYPDRVAFAKGRAAEVETAPRRSLRSFVMQRWRWSAKTGLNRQPALTATLGGVWAFHVGLWAGIPLALAGRLSPLVLAGAWAAKAGVDYVLLRSATGFFGRRDLLDATYPLQSIAHAAYVAGIGALALLPLDYTWKGRRWRV